MFLTPQHSSTRSSPPPLKVRSKTLAYAGTKVRTLHMPEQITIQPTTFEQACYYATTTRDVMTMNVYFIEVVDVYSSTLVYRIAPQPLMSSLTIESARAILQNVEVNVAEINTSSLDPFFQTNTDTFYLSLLTKL